ncbi:MAG TPA: hypothetical protein VN642_00625, partial [Dongiaceae bacterium]|nr:hypothetical protein [Dongiaceae bacterium]
MNRYLRALSAVFFVILMSPLLTSAAELSKGEKDTIYIGTFKVQPSVTEAANKKNRMTELKQVSNSLESQLISALNATRVFQLVEQSSKVDVEPEQEDEAV